MKRLLLLATLGTAILLTACGGSSNPAPPPPTGGFSNASLSGQYAFAMSGVDLSGAYISRVGSFIADGNGAITAAIEDVVSLNNIPPAALIAFSGGSYEIQANGRGVLVFQDPAGGGLTLNLVMNSTSQGVLVQSDLNAATSGGFNIQTPADFTDAAINGKFVFDVSGVSFAQNSSVAPISIIGQIAADGNGNVTGGTIDVNDGNATGPSGALALDPGTFQLDTSTDGAAFGRGTITFYGTNFAFYIVNSTHISLIEEDNFGGSQGDAFLQSSTVPTQNSQFTGSFTYLVGGASVLSPFGAVARAARFTADGSGNLGAISLDDNNDGRVSEISQGSNITNATYSIDTANAGSGRGTFTFKDSSLGTFTNVFYLISPTRGVIQDTSNGLICDGAILAQTGSPFAAAGIAGNYSTNWNGIQFGASTSAPYNLNFVGQYILSNASNNNISGVADFSQLGTANGAFNSNQSLTGFVQINGDGTNSNNVQMAVANSSSTTYNFKGYIANANTTFLVSSDTNRVSAGVSTLQVTPQ